MSRRVGPPGKDKHVWGDVLHDAFDALDRVPDLIHTLKRCRKVLLFHYWRTRQGLRYLQTHHPDDLATISKSQECLARYAALLADIDTSLGK